MTPKEQRKFFEKEIKPYVDKKLKEQAEQFHEYLIEEGLPVKLSFFKKFKRKEKK